jgi:NADPH:quinone reductase-like Zn-dependent oxidoreductase
MHVVEVVRFGGPEVLQPATRPDPAAGMEQVVVSVHAANVNPTDLNARQGIMPGVQIVPPFVLGWDFAGVVQAVGSGVSDYHSGDRVVGMIPWYLAAGTVGAYAQLAAVDTAWLAPLPAGLEDVPAATVPLNALTALQALALLDLPPSSTLLITGASGAVGSYATQLAVQAGHRVIAMAGRDDEDWVRGLGAADVLPRTADLRSIEQVAFVLDGVPLGAPALAALQDGGHVVSTRPIPSADGSRGLRQDVVRVRSNAVELRDLVAQVAAGTLRTRVARTLPLAQAAEAHRLVEAGGLHGKIVLTLQNSFGE